MMEMNMEYSLYPTVTQTERHPTMTTEKYELIPTSRVIEEFASLGWHPVSVSEADIRKPENLGFQRHAVVFRNEEFDRQQINVKGCKPQIVVLNAHNGSLALRILAGLFEVVCANGLITDRGIYDGRSLIHLDGIAPEVAWIVRRVAQTFPAVLETRERWRGVILPRDAQLAFAEAAANLRFGSTTAIAPSELLHVRHFEQNEPSLWNVYQWVQENVIKGGLSARARTGRRFRTRPIRSIDSDVRLNRALWTMAANLEQSLN